MHFCPLHRIETVWIQVSICNNLKSLRPALLTTCVRQVLSSVMPLILRWKLICIYACMFDFTKLIETVGSFPHFLNSVMQLFSRQSGRLHYFLFNKVLLNNAGGIPDEDLTLDPVSAFSWCISTINKLDVAYSMGHHESVSFANWNQILWIQHHHHDWERINTFLFFFSFRFHDPSPNNRNLFHNKAKTHKSFDIFSYMLDTDDRTIEWIKFFYGTFRTLSAIWRQ